MAGRRARRSASVTSPASSATPTSRADIQRGLTIAVFRGRHAVEPTELTDDEASRYGREVLRVGRAIEAAFSPVKVNYDVLGNSVPHLHTHIVPRYADDPRPGWPFPFPHPDPPAMPADRNESDLAAVRRAERGLA
jgi:diadenosine tetraphosphate (Ap4A) HIT family hydrolase